MIERFDHPSLVKRHAIPIILKILAVIAHVDFGHIHASRGPLQFSAEFGQPRIEFARNGNVRRMGDLRDGEGFWAELLHQGYRHLDR